MKYVVLGMAIVAATAVKGDDDIITIKGSPDCKSWVELRAEGPFEYGEDWIIGFLSGMSVGAQRNFWTAAGQDFSPEQIFIWTDSYCQAHPQDQLYDAAMSYFDKLAHP